MSWNPMSPTRVTHNRFARIILLSCLAATAGCTVNMAPDGGGGMDGEGGAGGAEPACYTPSADGEEISGDWMEANEHDEVTFTVPDDLGGGVVQVDLVASHDEVIPWVNITTGSDGGAIASGSAEGTLDEQHWTARFIAAPGQTYALEVFPFFNAPSDEYPVGYDLTWSFSGLLDCYEPNDTMEEAAPITLGDEVEALFTAGFVDNSNGNALDWYRFDLASASALRLALLDDVSSVGVRMRLFDADGRQLTSAGDQEPGLFEEATDVLDPGSYFIEMRLGSLSPVQHTLQDEADPVHWTDGYRFVVEEL